MATPLKQLKLNAEVLQPSDISAKYAEISSGKFTITDDMTIGEIVQKIATSFGGSYDYTKPEEETTEEQA